MATRKVTLAMYERSRNKARRITSDGEAVLGSPHDHKLYKTIRTDGEEIGKSAQPSLAYRQGLDVGFLLGIDAANPAATFVAPVPAPSVVPKKK